MNKSQSFSYLFGLVLVDGVQILFEHVLPELNFVSSQEIDDTADEGLVLQPIRIDQIVSLFFHN